MSTARKSGMCYSLGTSVGDIIRLNVANVVRFSLYSYRADLEIFDSRYFF